MKGLGGFNKSPAGIVMERQLQLPTIASTTALTERSQRELLGRQQRAIATSPTEEGR